MNEATKELYRELDKYQASLADHQASLTGRIELLERVKGNMVEQAVDAKIETAVLKAKLERKGE